MGRLNNFSSRPMTAYELYTKLVSKFKDKTFYLYYSEDYENYKKVTDSALCSPAFKSSKDNFLIVDEDLGPNVNCQDDALRVVNIYGVDDLLEWKFS